MSYLRIALSAVLFCLFSLGLHGQGFNRWYDAFGQGYAQGAFGIEQSVSGNLLLSASFEPDTITPDSLVGTYSLILQQIDLNGNLQWQRRYRRPQHAEFLGWADCCDTVLGGGYIIGGSSGSYSGLQEMRLVRFDAQGDSLWSRSYGSVGEFWIGQQVKSTSDGGFVLCGSTDAISYEDGCVIKTDAQGNEQWRQTYGLGGLAVDIFTSIIELPDGFVASGISYPNTNNSQFFAVRIDQLGGLVWTQRWGAIFDDASAYAYPCSDGNILIASAKGYANDGLSLAPYMAKLSMADGSIIWQREYESPSYNKFLFAAKECPNTDLIACGVTYAGGNEQGLLLKTASNGDSLWMRIYSYQDSIITQGSGRFWDVLPTADGGFIAAGFGTGLFNAPFPPGYSQDSWVVKVDSLGCIVPGCNGVGIVEQVTNLSGALKLYPNPVSVNGQVTVELTLPTSVQINTPLRLVLTSMQGQVVRELALPTQHDQRVVLDLGGLAAGLYSVHIADGGRWLTGARLVVADP